MKKPKAKAPKRSAKPEGNAAPDTQMPDLVAIMGKFTERLENVERKLDQVLSRIGQQNRPQQHNHPSQQRQGSQHHNQPRPQEQNFNRAPQPHHPQHPQRQPEPNFNRAPQPQGQPQNQNRGNGKPMHQAVCADCRQNCEVPFKPSAERPVFCKDCFAKRKANGNGQPKPQGGQPQTPAQPRMEQRQLKVIRHGGVGKVTISELVPAAPRPAAKKAAKPAAKKAKK